VSVCPLYTTESVSPLVVIVSFCPLFTTESVSPR